MTDRFATIAALTLATGLALSMATAAAPGTSASPLDETAASLPLVERSARCFALQAVLAHVAKASRVPRDDPAFRYGADLVMTATARLHLQGAEPFVLAIVESKTGAPIARLEDISETDAATVTGLTQPIVRAYMQRLRLPEVPDHSDVLALPFIRDDQASCTDLAEDLKAGTSHGD
ncbi:MAG: hypothetical protein AAGI51_10295 [Pseudomonadota bacterium]